MGYFIFRRSIQSLFSLVALVILVFFLSRLTGDPADLYLPIDATEEMRQQFDMQHGFNQPLYRAVRDVSDRTAALRLRPVASSSRGRRSTWCCRPFRPR